LPVQHVLKLSGSIETHPGAGRPASLVRRLGKFGVFLARGHGPRLAWWLAGHDALKRADYRGISLAALESAWRADRSWRDIAADAGRVHSRALGLEFKNGDAVDRGYATWRALADRGWKFERGNDGLIAHGNGLTLAISTAEEETMIKEIFFDRCYDFRLPGSWQVVDIGANVGMAALFFASQTWVNRVFSFEPFAPTADAFRSNLQLNLSLSQKISLSQTGLGANAATLSVDYHAALRGSMTLTGVGQWRGRPGTTGHPILISVERASAALSPIIAGRNGHRLLAKIDCEGSEYDILGDLDASGMLEYFSAFVIEWHARGPDELVRLLSGHGYALHVQPLSPDETALGLIYATKLPAES